MTWHGMAWHGMALAWNRMIFHFVGSLCHSFDILYFHIFSTGVTARAKKPVGARLAQAALPVAYGQSKHTTGPTVSGCTADATSNSITVTFNQTLLSQAGAENVVVRHQMLFVKYSVRQCLTVVACPVTRAFGRIVIFGFLTWPRGIMYIVTGMA